MPVLLFQAFVVATILLSRMRSRRAATIACIAWSIFTLIMVFMPWLMILQLSIVWGTHHLATRGRIER